MQRIVVGLVVVPACIASPRDEVRSLEQSIIGGQLANPADYPSVVALEGTPGNWFCTGTLISSEWILTAAHCVDGQTPSNTNIRFGDPDANTAAGGTVVAVSGVFSNPAFNLDLFDNDIALIKLARPVTDRAPTPIHRARVPPPTAVIEVGYGVADNNDGGGGLLRKVDKITADCAGANDPTISGDHLLCMNVSDGRGSCYGDSGGPAFATFNAARVVVGVTSAGSGQLCGAGWDLYTSVYDELAFIDSIVGVVPPPEPPMDPNMDPGTGTPPPNDGEDTPNLNAGCSATGSASALLVLALVGLRRRRK